MGSTNEIKYYDNINAVEIFDLDAYFAQYVKTNNRKLLDKPLVLADSLINDSLYQIFIAIDAELRVYFRLCQNNKFISIEYTNQDYKGSGKAFLSLLVLMKKLIKDNK